MKKSFIVHLDSLNVLDVLNDEQIWILFRAMKEYNESLSYNISDKIVEIAFLSFKNQFDRDIEKYDSIVKRNRDNGSKWWRPNNPENPSGFSINPEEPKKADNDSDSVPVNDSDNGYENINTFREKVKWVKELLLNEWYSNKDLDEQILICHEHFKWKWNSKIPSTQYHNWIKKRVEWWQLSKPKKKMEYATLDD